MDLDDRLFFHPLPGQALLQLLHLQQPLLLEVFDGLVVDILDSVLVGEALLD